MKLKFYIVIFIFLAIATGSIIGAVLALTGDLPQIRALEDFRPSAITRIYSSDQVVLGELYTQKRQPVALKVIPRHLIDALISVEDREFYSHSGIYLKGIIRAVVKDILAGAYVEGASTITQQLAKTLFLTPRKNLMRKLQEAILAFQLERRYTKDEILELYLNQVYFGSGAYGVASAAHVFFGKSVQDLSLPECALIVGTLKAPSRYNPVANPDLAVERRNTVLHSMFTAGVIDKPTYQQAKTRPLRVAKSSENTPQNNQVGYFMDYIKKELEEIVGANQLYKGGLTVHTTLSYSLQQAANEAIQKGLPAIKARMANNNIPPKSLQGALTALDIQSGGILAMIGGHDYQKSPFNRATDAFRQPGSAFKPILYAYAIEKGFSQNDTLLDAPVIYKGAIKGQDWRPENFSKSYHGELTLRRALAFSENIPAVRLIEKLGPTGVARFAQKLGISTPVSPNLTLALGTSEVSLLDLTSAYTVFANQGKRISPYGIMEVLDNKGRRLWQVKPVKNVVMSRDSAAVMTDMLTAVIKEGTGQAAKRIGHRLGGKTGTTDTYRDALFVGFSPSVAVGVWVGNDNHASLGPRETGAKAALPIWMNFMQKALKKSPQRNFDHPDDVIYVPIDPASGQRVSPKTPGAVRAAFIKGTEP
jgi:penicillin-binding protein 1A